jgi:hypothetical protein
MLFGPRSRTGNGMNARALMILAGSRPAPRVLMSALFVLAGVGMQTVSAEEPRTHPSQYSDPRCESRRTGPHLDRDELRCDPRAQPRHAGQPPPPTKPPPPPANTPAVGQAPAVTPGNQPSRVIERDVGFDDAFTTQGNAAQAAGAAAASPGAAGAGGSVNPGGAAAAAGAPPGLGGPSGAARGASSRH